MGGKVRVAKAAGPKPEAPARETTRSSFAGASGLGGLRRRATPKPEAPARETTRSSFAGASGLGVGAVSDFCPLIQPDRPGTASDALHTFSRLCVVFFWCLWAFVVPFCFLRRGADLSARGWALRAPGPALPRPALPGMSRRGKAEGRLPRRSAFTELRGPGQPRALADRAQADPGSRDAAEVEAAAGGTGDRSPRRLDRRLARALPDDRPRRAGNRGRPADALPQGEKGGSRH
jgi:hypothetical protein